MRVSELIKNLQERYNPDDELVVDYWDKDLIEQWNGSPIDDLLWSEFVERVHEEFYYHHEVWHNQAMELLNDLQGTEA